MVASKLFPQWSLVPPLLKGGWHDHSSSYSVALKLDRISLYMSLNASLIQARLISEIVVLRPTYCPKYQLTSNMAPAHPHATGKAVYPALLSFKIPSSSIFVLAQKIEISK